MDRGKSSRQMRRQSFIKGQPSPQKVRQTRWSGAATHNGGTCWCAPKARSSGCAKTFHGIEQTAQGIPAGQQENWCRVVQISCKAKAAARNIREDRRPASARPATARQATAVPGRQPESARWWRSGINRARGLRVQTRRTTRVDDERCLHGRRSAALFEAISGTASRRKAVYRWEPGAAAAERMKAPAAAYTPGV